MDNNKGLNLVDLKFQDVSFPDSVPEGSIAQVSVIVQNMNGSGTGYILLESVTGATYSENTTFPIGSGGIKAYIFSVPVEQQKSFKLSCGNIINDVWTETDWRMFNIDVTTPVNMTITQLYTYWESQAGGSGGINVEAHNSGGSGYWFIRIKGVASGEEVGFQYYSIGAGVTSGQHCSYQISETAVYNVEVGRWVNDTATVTDSKQITIVFTESGLPEPHFISQNIPTEVEEGTVARINFGFRNDGSEGDCYIKLYDVTHDQVLEFNPIVMTAGQETSGYFDTTVNETTRYQLTIGSYISSIPVETDIIDFIINIMVDKYILTVTTRPPECNVKVESPTFDPVTIISNADGLATFYDLPADVYDVTVSKSGFTSRTVVVNLVGFMGIVIDITESPSFWSDPLGWIQYFVISTIENLLGWISGSLTSILQQTWDFFGGIYIDIELFFSDLSTNIMNVVTPYIQGFTDWIDNFPTLLSDWWNERIIDINLWISNAVASISAWIDETYANINEWWNDISTVIGTWIDDALTDINLWIADFVINVTSWYNENIDPFIQSINNSLIGAVEWISNFPSTIADWWNTMAAAIGIWWSSQLEILGSAWNEFISMSGSVWDGILQGIKDYFDTLAVVLEETIWNNILLLVETMFDWAKPVVQPIIDAVGYLGQLLGIFDKSYEEDPDIRDNINESQSIMDQIKDIIEGL